MFLMSLSTGVVSVLVTFIEVPPPGPFNVPDEIGDHTDSPTDSIRSTLDGTTAPQGRRVVGCSTLDLRELLCEIGQGSHEAFTEFYRRSSPRVFGLVRSVLIDPGLSEEVTQEVFIVVWRDAAAYDPARGSPMTWLLTIAHRKAVDRVRSQQSSADRNARWATASYTRPYDEVATSLVDRMESLQLMDSVDALSPLQREAIMLAYFGALTYREVAVTLSKPLPTVKSRIRDGLNQLREQLKPA